MKQPTDEQIDNAIDETFSRRYALSEDGFIKGVKWLLEWQKTQPLTVYYVMVGEETVIDIRRTKESAKARISELSKDHLDVFFWIDEREIK